MSTRPGGKPRLFVLSGGGSGGHIRPLLAVADELKLAEPDCVVVSIGDRGSAFAHLTESHPSIDYTKAVFAGKFRRYHGESWLRRITDFRTILLNVRDVFYVIFGVLQSVVLIGRLRPNLVFLKGGFVGVPVGLAAALWRVPIVTHDSDTIPGLANRIIGRWARIHATGMPAEFYSYDKAKVRHVGVLVSRDYVPVTDHVLAHSRQQIGVPEQGSVLLITGGSLGSQRINTACGQIVPELLTAYPDLTVIHQVGRGNAHTYGDFTHDRLQVHEFLNPFHHYSAAADVIVTRAGANNIAEFGIQHKACVVIPSPFLAGGHQLKNGEYLQAQQAAIVVDEAVMLHDLTVLKAAIADLLDDQHRRQELGDALGRLATPDAAEKLAGLLIETAR